MSKLRMFLAGFLTYAALVPPFDQNAIMCLIGAALRAFLGLDGERE